jgi:hypothetical protein
MRVRTSAVDKVRGISPVVILMVFCSASVSPIGQETNRAAGKDIQVTVTVERQGPNAPAVLYPADVFVYQNNQRRPVVRWVPATGDNAGLDLAILIDDSLDHDIGSQFPDIKDFIRSLPESARVAIAYGMYGNANMAQDFTADHEKAIAALRLPQGQLNQTSSIFMALTDLIKHWPADGNRRTVLLLSDGIDLYWGVTEALPPNNPSLEQAIRAAQRQGVSVFAIYAETAGTVRRNAFLVSAGQSCLSVLALATGGEAYIQGLQTPIDFRSIFRKLKGRLGEQYLLTFKATQGSKDSYDRLRLSTEQPGIELIGPSRVFVPAAGAAR